MEDILPEWQTAWNLTRRRVTLTYSASGLGKSLTIMISRLRAKWLKSETFESVISSLTWYRKHLVLHLYKKYAQIWLQKFGCNCYLFQKIVIYKDEIQTNKVYSSFFSINTRFIFSLSGVKINISRVVIARSEIW